MSEPDRFDVSVRARAQQRVTLGRLVIGGSGRNVARFEVVVVDRATGETLAALPADGTQKEAEGFGHFIGDELARLGLDAFLNRYVQQNTRRKRPRGRLLG